MAYIFVDTNGEIPFKTAQALGVCADNLIRMPYSLDGVNEYYDLGENFVPKEYYDRLRKGAAPATSALNSEEYREYFEPVFAKNEDILYISFSHKLSGTFQQMEMTVKELSAKYPKARFTCFDTKGISMAAGFAQWVGLKMAREGKSVDEIVAALEPLITKTCLTFVVDDLNYLMKGGRLGAGAAFIGTILQMKPIIKLNKVGEIYNAGKVSGTNKAIATLADEVIQNADTSYPVYMSDGDATANADKLYEKIKAGLPNAEIWRHFVGPVLGGHAGPEALAVAYVSKTPVR